MNFLRLSMRTGAGERGSATWSTCADYLTVRRDSAMDGGV